MTSLRKAALGLLMLTGAFDHAFAQNTIKIGEFNSYKVIPAFLEPYKKGWMLALARGLQAGGDQQGGRYPWPSARGDLA